VDRHEHIGHGKIGAAAFTRLLQHPRFGAMPPEGVLGRAFLLETPIEHPGDDRKNVAKLWELAGVEGPPAEKGYSMLTAAMKKMMKKKRGKEVKRQGSKEVRKKSASLRVKRRS
jgi:hypothetical protein